MFWIGLAVGLVPWLVYRFDRWLAEVEGDRPVVWWWARRTARLRRAADKWAAGFVVLPPVRRLLARRPWRVAYVSYCTDGPPPIGWAPYVAETTRHWTMRGAEWRRRKRPLGSTWGAGGVVTCLERGLDLADPDPWDLSGRGGAK